jgi:hypothetical protein
LPHTIPVEQKKQYARSLLSILGLEKQADMVIGNNMQDGISADQRKRVTMGVEMAADPAILFLDEVCCRTYVAFLIPASNIPNHYCCTFLELCAADVGSGLVWRRARDEGRAEHLIPRHAGGVHHPPALGHHLRPVHPPPTAQERYEHSTRHDTGDRHDTTHANVPHIFIAGGYTTYFGPIGERPGDCSIMLDYFSSALGRQLKPFQNPAEFILEVTGAGTQPRLS